MFRARIIPIWKEINNRQSYGESQELNAYGTDPRLISLTFPFINPIALTARAIALVLLARHKRGSELFYT